MWYIVRVANIDFHAVQHRTSQTSGWFGLKCIHFHDTVVMFRDNQARTSLPKQWNELCLVTNTSLWLLIIAVDCKNSIVTLYSSVASMCDPTRFHLSRRRNDALISHSSIVCVNVYCKPVNASSQLYKWNNSKMRYTYSALNLNESCIGIAWIPLAVGGTWH